MFNYRRNTRKGFSLIELLVVIAVVGLLSTIVLRATGNARTQARDARRISDLNQVKNALDLYFAENGVYPLRQIGGFSDCMSNENDLALCNSMASTYITTGGNCIDFGAYSWGWGYGCDGYDWYTWTDLKSALNKYNKNLPNDPNNTAGGYGAFNFPLNNVAHYNYAYIVSGDGKKYELHATFEKPKKQDCGGTSASVDTYQASIGALDSGYGLYTSADNVNYCYDLGWSQRTYVVKSKL